MFENNGLIAEGAIQLLIVIIVAATIYRRGKNPYLTVLGSFFFVIGLLSLFLGFFTDAGTKVGQAFSFSLPGLLAHEMVYYGVAWYLIFQLGMIYGRKIWPSSLIGVLLVAMVSIAAHIYYLPIFNLSIKNKIAFSMLSPWLSFAFFILSMVTMIIILIFLFRQLRGDRLHPELNYVSTICTGISVMVAAILILKALNPLMGDSSADLVTFISYGLAFAGFVIQFSLISLPGIVYNYETHAPVQLAMVRIMDKTNNRLIESKVTGANGRYEILLDAGRYALMVFAVGYKFPSEKIIGYQGEEIEIKRPTLISLDIPLEPIKN